MEKSFRALVPLVIWTAFPLLILHTMLYAKPTYCYDGREGLFVCGLTPVENSFYNWGYADEHGRKVIPCKYRVANPFDKNERAIVSDGERDYLITTSGRIIAKNSYKRVTEYDEEKGLYLINGGRCANIMDKNGKCLLKGKYDRLSDSILDADDYFSACKDGKYGVIDIDENVIVPFDYDERIFGYCDSLSTFKYGKEGVININNEVLVPFVYDMIMSDDSFYDVRENGKYGVADKDMNIIIPVVYESVEVEDDKFVRVRQGQCYGILDMNGNELLSPIFLSLSKRTDGCWAGERGGKVFVFDENFEEIEEYFCEDREAHESDLPPLDYVTDTSSYDHSSPDIEEYDVNGFYAKLENEWLTVTDSDNEVVYEAPCTDLDAALFDDYIRVYHHGKCTVLDKNFRKVFTIKTDYLSTFEDDGYAVFTRGKHLDKYGVVNSKGRIMFRPKYIGIEDYNDDGA